MSTTFLGRFYLYRNWATTLYFGIRLGSATAMTDCSVLRIDKKFMMEVIHREHAFSDMFVAYLLTRNIRREEDLVDQLFNSSEKRLLGSSLAGSFRPGR